MACRTADDPASGLRGNRRRGCASDEVRDTRVTYGQNQPDPFGGNPFGSDPFSASSGYPAGQPPKPPGWDATPPPPEGPRGEVNTLATLSVVFAVVLAPVGAVLGHVALAQIAQSGQRGRERALIGLTLSYVFIALAVIALVLWLILGGGPDATPSTPASMTTTTTSPTAAAPPPPPTTVVTPRPRTTVVTPPPRTTVVTPPPTQRPRVHVEELQVGDCVEVQHNEPVPGEPSEDYIFIYRTSCQARDGVLQVDLITSSLDACPGYSLLNGPETLFACASDFRR